MRASDKTVGEVARDLKTNDTTLGNWVKADRADRAERGESDWPAAVDGGGAGGGDAAAAAAGERQLKTERKVLSKAAAFFVTESTKSTRFAFIDREKAHHDVTVLGRPEVSRSGYYAWRSRPASARGWPMRS